MKKILGAIVFIWMAVGFASAQATWFIRADGGTRFSSHVAGQCDGLADVAYPGSGTNQHCAFNDFRYLWSDNTTFSGAGTWVIAGGDTVVVRGCHALASQQNPSNPNCRLGWDIATGGNPPNAWCYTIGNTGCFNPPVPSGTSGTHTRILGGCAYDSTPGPCNTGNVTNVANLTQLFAGMDLAFAFNLKGSAYVDIQGIELTTHNKVNSGTAFIASTAYTLGQTIFDGTNTEKVTTAGTSGAAPTWNTNADPALGSVTTTTGAATFTNLGPNCITTGNPRYPIDCQHSSTPYDDYGGNGFLTSNLSGNLLFQDVYVHGFSSAGFYGAIGGAVTMTRVNSSYNSFAGWNFDIGTSGPNSTGFPNNPTASITASYVTMDWNGCNQEYPITHAIPTQSCYSILNGGFGDAWSGQNSHLGSMTCDHCEMANNVKDPFFGPHTAISNVAITNSYAGNNGGQTWKGNLGGNGTWLMKNTVTDNNCRRKAMAFAGQPASYFNGISNADYCRADGASYAIVWPVTGSFEIDNSTFITASLNTAFDFGCWSVPSTVVPVKGGTGYSVNDVIYIGANVVATVTSVSAGGVITGMSMTTPGQVLSATAYTEVYSFDLTNPTGASGATFTIGGETGANCGGGPRILRNNVFIGYTNPNNLSWNGQTLSFICYSGCQANPGTSNDSQWTIRTNNYYFGFKAGSFACTYVGEVCASPGMVSQPSQTWINEAALDVYNPHLTSNSFYPTSISPLISAGTTYTGLPAADYYATGTTSPPVIGAVNQSGSVTLSSITVLPNPASVTTSSTVNMQTSSFCTMSDSSTIAAGSAGCVVVWTDTNSHSSINSSTGVVTGSSVGSDTVTATLSPATPATATVNVAAPSVVHGVSVGVGATIGATTSF